MLRLARVFGSQVPRVAVGDYGQQFLLSQPAPLAKVPALQPDIVELHE